MTFEAQVPFPRLYIAVPLRILSKVYTSYNMKKKNFCLLCNIWKVRAATASLTRKQRKKTTRHICVKCSALGSTFLFCCCHLNKEHRKCKENKHFYREISKKSPLHALFAFEWYFSYVSLNLKPSGVKTYMIAISFPFTDAGREFILILEPLLKTKKCVKESTLFNHIHKHNFGGLGTDTLTFCKSTPFITISWIFCTLTCAKEESLPSSFS